MSAPQTTDTDTVVYVRLLDEGTDVWRPAPATPLPDGAYELAEPAGYDPEAERWEFPPHTCVRCLPHRFADGKHGLVAVASFSDPH